MALTGMPIVTAFKLATTHRCTEFIMSDSLQVLILLDLLQGSCAVIGSYNVDRLVRQRWGINRKCSVQVLLNL